jgi:putative hydrolase
MRYFDHDFEVDTHVHTMLSGHSWSSFDECVFQAKRAGLKAFCLTEHSGVVPNGPPEWLPMALPMLPDHVEGLRVYHGLEADITGVDDIRPQQKYLAMLEFVIASNHSFSAAANFSEQERTESYLNALANPLVHVLGHIDSPGFICDTEAVVREAAKRGRLIELNNSSLNPRRRKDPAAYRELMRLCAKHGTRVCVGSDAHYHRAIGDFQATMALMEKTRFPRELALNYEFVVFDKYIEGLKEGK